MLIIKKFVFSIFSTSPFTPLRPLKKANINKPLIGYDLSANALYILLYLLDFVCFIYIEEMITVNIIVTKN